MLQKFLSSISCACELSSHHKPVGPGETLKFLQIGLENANMGKFLTRKKPILCAFSRQSGHKAIYLLQQQIKSCSSSLCVFDYSPTAVFNNFIKKLML